MDLGLAGKIAVVTGASRGIGLAVARLLAAEGASVVAGARTVESLDALGGVSGFAVDYGAAKAALLNTSKALSQELGPKGIRINSVSPGQVATDLWLGDHGVAAMIGEATGSDPTTVRERAGGFGPPGRCACGRGASP